MKGDDHPMNRLIREPLPLRLAPKCLAKNRAGTPVPASSREGNEAVQAPRRRRRDRSASGRAKRAL
jgi:hypothetical protein